MGATFDLGTTRAVAEHRRIQWVEARWVAADDGPWLALTFAGRMAFIYVMERSYRFAKP